MWCEGWLLAGTRIATIGYKTPHSWIPVRSVNPRIPGISRAIAGFLLVAGLFRSRKERVGSLVSCIPVQILMGKETMGVETNHHPAASPKAARQLPMQHTVPIPRPLSQCASQAFRS